MNSITVLLLLGGIALLGAARISLTNMHRDVWNDHSILECWEKVGPELQAIWDGDWKTIVFQYPRCVTDVYETLVKEGKMDLAVYNMCLGINVKKEGCQMLNVPNADHVKGDVFHHCLNVIQKVVKSGYCDGSIENKETLSLAKEMNTLD